MAPELTDKGHAAAGQWRNDPDELTEGIGASNSWGRRLALTTKLRLHLGSRRSLVVRAREITHLLSAAYPLHAAC
ncbi:hypothetical protein Dxin01_03352 [Deinococcus xinjiangensis]|uniref:Transposase DDE domain-containing protein n=1 Tax=Deinococcus xinjiangensis TaxID=457454 RepID=A0ABP9VED8_9DEIO